MENYFKNIFKGYIRNILQIFDSKEKPMKKCANMSNSLILEEDICFSSQFNEKEIY